MEKTIHEKIVRIEHLVAKKKEIEKELEAILGKEKVVVQKKISVKPFKYSPEIRKLFEENPNFLFTKEMIYDYLKETFNCRPRSKNIHASIYYLISQGKVMRIDGGFMLKPKENVGFPTAIASLQAEATHTFPPRYA